jgi:hypothetical protein
VKKEPTPPNDATDRPVCLDTADGYLVYDVEEPQSWIVSETAVSLDNLA